MLLRLKDWAGRQIEKRMRAEWADYRRDPQMRVPLFRRRAKDGVHVSRSLIEINFHRRESR